MNTYEQPLAQGGKTNEVPASSPVEKNSVSAAISQVGMIYQMAMGMGANDYEKSAFPMIMAKLQAGSYEDPRTAIAEAQEILEKKNAYH